MRRIFSKCIVIIISILFTLLLLKHFNNIKPHSRVMYSNPKNILKLKSLLLTRYLKQCNVSINQNRSSSIQINSIINNIFSIQKHHEAFILGYESYDIDWDYFAQLGIF